MADSFSVSIIGIIQHTAQGTVCFDATFSTVEETLSKSVYSTVLALEIVKPHSTVHQFIDFNKFITKYHPTLTDWDTVSDACEEHMSDDTWSELFVYTSVPKYQDYAGVVDGVRVNYHRVTPFNANMKDHVSTFSLDHSNYVTGSYLNKKAPYIRNVKARIRTMPDLVFTKTNQGDVDFTNTLVSIDGNFGYPEYSEKTDELYIKNGAYFLRGTIGPDQNVVFFDFSDFVASGSFMKSYYFHECYPDLIIKEGDEVQIYHNDTPVVDTLINRDINFWKNSDITIKFSVPIEALPEDQHYLPLVCFGGKLFFPVVDEVDYFTYEANGNSFLGVSLHIILDRLVKIVAANLQHAGIFLGNSSFYPVAISYILSNIFTTRAYNIPVSSEEWRAISYLCKADIPFISLLTADKPYSIEVTRPNLTLHDGELAFPSGSRGFLRSIQTMEIIDYNRVEYADHTRIETEPHRALYLSPNGCMASSLNPGRTYVTEETGGPAILQKFPVGTEINYSTLDGNCYVARGVDGSLIAKSDICESSVAYTDSSLKWYIYETPLFVEDSLKQDSVMTETNIALFKDERNRVTFAKNIKDNHQSVLIDIVYAGKRSSIVEDKTDVIDITVEPDAPVHTIEFQYIMNPVRKQKED